MPRIKVYKVKRNLSRIMIGFGLVISLIAVYLMITFSTTEGSFRWIYVVSIVQGFIFLYLGFLNLYMDRYFVEWNNHQLKYLLPETKTEKSIDYQAIQDISIDQMEIGVKMIDAEHYIPLHSMQYEQIRQLKDHFEKLKADLN